MICPICNRSHQAIELNFAGVKHRLIPCEHATPGFVYFADNVNMIVDKAFEITVDRLKEISSRYLKELEREVKNA